MGASQRQETPSLLALVTGIQELAQLFRGLLIWEDTIRVHALVQAHGPCELPTARLFGINASFRSTFPLLGHMILPANPTKMPLHMQPGPRSAPGYHHLFSIVLKLLACSCPSA